MISLVMTTYNGLKYISEQLDSIRTQTLLPDEVLIYDDRSTDGTYEYVQEYIDRYNLHTWKVYRNKENKGYSLNFSNAIDAAKGELIFLCDQDDIWHSDKIEKMSKIMEENSQIELLASNVHPFYMGEHPQRVHYQKYKGDLIRIRRLGEWIKPARPGCTMCFRRTLMKNYQSLWFREYPHDCLLWGLAVLQGKAYIYNRETIEFRRHDSNSIFGVILFNYILAFVFSIKYYDLKYCSDITYKKAFSLTLYASFIYTVFFQFFTDYFFARLSVGLFIEVIFLRICLYHV